MRPKMLLAAVVVGAASLLIRDASGSRARRQPRYRRDRAGDRPQRPMIADENVFKVTKPRTDVKIQVDQWTMPPFMGLGSWAAFTPAHGGRHDDGRHGGVRG